MDNSNCHWYIYIYIHILEVFGTNVSPSLCACPSAPLPWWKFACWQLMEDETSTKEKIATKERSLLRLGWIASALVWAASPLGKLMEFSFWSPHCNLEWPLRSLSLTLSSSQTRISPYHLSCVWCILLNWGPSCFISASLCCSYSWFGPDGVSVFLDSHNQCLTWRFCWFCLAEACYCKFNLSFASCRSHAGAARGWPGDHGLPVYQGNSIQDSTAYVILWHLVYYFSCHQDSSPLYLHQVAASGHEPRSASGADGAFCCLVGKPTLGPLGSAPERVHVSARSQIWL